MAARCRPSLWLAAGTGVGAPESRLAAAQSEQALERWCWNVLRCPVPVLAEVCTLTFTSAATCASESL